MNNADLLKSYEENDYSVNISLLNRDRPIGVSGLLRIKNDADFVDESIESCISALDELIIVYQDSEDNTLEKVLKIQSKYPDKVRFFYYKPVIHSHNLSDKEFEEISKLSKDSIHLLSNYYNYTLSKANYKYAFKIDADQIYFTDKLKEVCDLYRTENFVHVTPLEYLSFQYTYFMIRCCSKIPFFLNSYTAPVIFPGKINNLYTRYVNKIIQNKKCISSYSGLNIFKDKKIYIPLGTFYDKVQPPINGSGDHLIFPISTDTVYVPYYDRKSHRIIEVMNVKEKVYWNGFLWLHLNSMRSTIYKKNINLYKGRCMEYRLFLQQKFFVVEKAYKFKIASFMRSIIYIFLKKEKGLLYNQIKSIFNK